MEATLSAVLVRMPEAEPAVADQRARFDKAAFWGVPAHVTVLYPFVSPAMIDDGVLRRAALAAQAMPAFDVVLAGTEWFGETVLWVAPDPAEPFRRLTAAFGDAFPEHPPYGGAFDDVVPHLTVGHDVELVELLRAEAVVRGRLPVRQRVDAVEVWTGSQAAGTWACLARVPLGG